MMYFGAFASFGDWVVGVCLVSHDLAISDDSTIFVVSSRFLFSSSSCWEENCDILQTYFSEKL